MRGGGERGWGEEGGRRRHVYMFLMRDEKDMYVYM